MNIIRRSGWLIPVLIFPLFADLDIYADVIYLNNGSVLLVQKAWEEGDEVKYQTSQGIQSIPKATVKSVRHETPASSSPANTWSRVGSGNQTATTSAEPAPAIAPPSGGTPVSKETLVRLRGNLNAAPSDPAAKAELVNALNSLASLQFSQGDFASARASLEEGVKLDARNPTLLANLATVHFRLGDYQKAEDILIACVAVDSRNQRTRYLLGEAYYRQEKIAQAISEWTEALQSGPNDVISQRLEKARRESGVHNELSPERSAHFILRYDSRTSPSSLGQHILETLEEQYRRLSSELSSLAPATVAVILYPDRAYFDVTRAPGWAGGTFDGKIRIPSKGLYSVTPELKAALAHELTHSFMAALPGRGSPTWFLEGMAQMEEGRTAAEDRKTLAQLQKESRLIPLRDLRGSFMGLPAGTAALAYAEGLSAVEYLTARFGRTALRNLLDLMAQNYNFENAFNTAMQRSVSEFETAWQRDLTQ